MSPLRAAAIPPHRIDARVGALRQALVMRYFGVGKPPDARKARELAGARVAQELFSLDVGSVGWFFPVRPRPILHPYAVIRSLALALEFAEVLELPAADARHLARVLGQVAIGIDRTLACAKHSDQKSKRFGVSRPVAPVADRVAAQHLGDCAEGPLGGKLAHPAGLVVDGAGVDARTCEELPDGAVALLRADPQEVRLQDGRAQFLLAALSHGAPSDRRNAAAHRTIVRAPVATGKARRTRPQGTCHTRARRRALGVNGS